MRKISIILIIFMVFVPVVFAGTPYVDKINIEANVTKSGDMLVTEDITYSVEGQLNGTYRDIEFLSDNELNSAEDMEVLSVIVDGTEYEYSLETLYNGDSGRYNLNTIDKGVQVKIFMPSNNEKRNVVIKYQLNDVVVKYNDIAELYWNFIGDGWDNPLRNVSITINLPDESIENLRVWGHGPLNGVSQIIDSKTVNLNIDRLPANQFLDARVVFDTNVVGGIKKVQNVDKLDGILEKEGKLAEETNLKRKMNNKLVVLDLIIYVFLFINMIIIIVKYRRGIRKPNFTGDYYRELVEDYGPAIMNSSLGLANTSYSNNMVATLLDLTRRKYIKVEKIMVEGKDKSKDYELTLLKSKGDIELDNGLKDFERFFITDLLFYKEGKITFKELKKENLKNQIKLAKNYEKWQKKIEEGSKEVGILEKSKQKLGKIISKNISFAIIFSIIQIITELCLGYTFFTISLFVNIFFTVIFASLIIDEKKHTEKGIEHKAMWKAFKKFLIDFSNIKDYEVESIVIWEHYLVYAAGLGIADKVIEKLKIAFPDEFDERGVMVANNHIVMGICGDVNSFKTFSDSFTMSSASDGYGGGFSSGGRWRWRPVAAVEASK